MVELMFCTTRALASAADFPTKPLRRIPTQSLIGALVETSFPTKAVRDARQPSFDTAASTQNTHLP